jgi:hypothetical protein
MRLKFKEINWLSLYLYTSLSLSFILTILFTYWTVRPYKVIQFKNQPFEILTPVVKAGETLRYRLDYCKYMDIGSQITRSFIDGVIYDTPPFKTHRDIGCHETVVELKVPKTLQSGRYFLQIDYRYQVNPIRNEDITARTQEFDIIEQ